MLEQSNQAAKAEELQKQQVQEPKEIQKTETLEIQDSEYDNYFLGGCKDSDGGKNFYEAGTTVSKTGTPNNDQCNTNSIQYPNRLYEFHCDTNEMARKITFECANGCKEGACIK